MSHRNGKLVKSPVDDYYTALLCRLRALDGRSGNPRQAIGITSCLPGEGASTVACQLAIHASRQLPGRVLLLDADVGGHALATGNGDGTNGETRKLELANCLPTQHEDLSYFRWSGGGSAGGSDILAKFLTGAHAEFDLVIIDLPKASPLTSCASLAARLDGVIMVVQAERVGRMALEQAQKDFSQAGAAMLGVVYNRRREHLPKWLRRFFSMG